jgi:hypothetical protein
VHADGLGRSPVRGRRAVDAATLASRRTIPVAVIVGSVVACPGLERSGFVTDLSAAVRRFAAAAEVFDVLDRACLVFEDILAVLRRHQEQEASAFPAFVLATCAAANGRDWTGGQWTPQPAAREQDPGSQPMDGVTVAEVAVAIAAACEELSVRLSACAAAAACDADRECCEHAAAEAATIRALLGGASPP